MWVALIVKDRSTNLSLETFPEMQPKLKEIEAEPILKCALNLLLICIKKVLMCPLNLSQIAPLEGTVSA